MSAKAGLARRSPASRRRAWPSKNSRAAGARRSPASARSAGLRPSRGRSPAGPRAAPVGAKAQLQLRDHPQGSFGPITRSSRSMSGCTNSPAELFTAGGRKRGSTRPAGARSPPPAGSPGRWPAPPAGERYCEPSGRTGAGPARAGAWGHRPGSGPGGVGAGHAAQGGRALVGSGEEQAAGNALQPFVEPDQRQAGLYPQEPAAWLRVRVRVRAGVQDAVHPPQVQHVPAQRDRPATIPVLPPDRDRGPVSQGGAQHSRTSSSPDGKLSESARPARRDSSRR